jgi:hypothetical protein
VLNISLDEREAGDTVLRGLVEFFSPRSGITVDANNHDAGIGPPAVELFQSLGLLGGLQRFRTTSTVGGGIFFFSSPKTASLNAEGSVDLAGW